MALICAVCVWADEPFRNHRYDSFKVLAPAEGSILFLGNSITDMHCWPEAFKTSEGNYLPIVNRGVSGTYSTEQSNNLESYLANKPKKVFMMIGTNDLASSGGLNFTGEQILAYVKSIVERIQKRSPQTKIYLYSILNNNTSNRQQERWLHTNELVKAYAEENAANGVTYIDLYESLAGIASGGVWSYDNLHLTAAAYKVWCETICQYLEEGESYTVETVYKENTSEVQNNGGLTGANGMRATYFSMMPIAADDILVFGDEMVKNGEWQELLGNLNIKNRGTAWGYGGDIATTSKLVDATYADTGASKTDAKAIFLYTGTADANGTTDLETVKTSYKALVDKIVEKSPTSKLYLMSLCPTSNADNNSNRISVLNAYMETIANESDKIGYVDIYTPLLNGTVANTAYFYPNNYLGGKGYIKVAAQMKAALEADFSSLSLSVISDDEAEKRHTQAGLRNQVSQAIAKGLVAERGSAVGQYDATKMAAFDTEAAAAYTLLAKSEITADEASAQATALNNTLLEALSMPTASSGETEYWYQITSLRSADRYIAPESDGEVGVIGSQTENQYASSMWKFVERDDNTFDIINREYSTYLNPVASYNTQIFTTATRPTAGWTVSYSNTAGYYIISAGEVQLNQTGQAQNYALYNWSASANKGSDRSDQGCQLKITIAPDPIERPYTPESVEYTVDKANGDLYRGTSVNQAWNSAWKSNTTPQLQFSCGANNMNWVDNNIQLMTGSATTATYTLTAPTGYVIEEYSFTFANNGHSTGLSLTMSDGAAYTTSTTAKTLSATKQKLASISFVLAGANGNGVLLTNFTVKVKQDKQYKPEVSTEENQYWYYIASAATNTYCKDKVMYYDREAERMRFGDKSFNADRIWSFWEQNGKLAIKNYRGEYIGTAGSGTGGSTAFGIADGANYIYTIEDAYDYFIIKDEGTELHAQQSGQLIVRWASEEGNASLWRFDEVDVSSPEALVANTSVEQGKVSTGIGNINQPIVRSTIRVSGLTGTCDFQAVKGRFVGTSSADIANVKAYFASNARELFIDAENKMSWREQNGTQYGATVELADDGTFTITGSKELAPGEYYLWITYDIATDATEGNTVDTEIISYTVDGEEIVETNGNPAHAVTIFLSEGAVLMPMDKGSLYYRIPAITVSKDGARLVTLTDDRKSHNSDLPSHCYLVAQYSEDLGKTWSDPVTVAGTATTGGNYGHGDASIVTNRDNGEIVGIMTSAGTYGHGFFAGTAEEPPRWKTITSRDGGITWEAPVDHTDDLFGANCSNPNTNTWKSGFSGSGAALQKRNGTLVSSFVNREADNSQNFYFFMSDDGGKNWYVSGTSGTTSADEPKTLERNNGDLAISVRASGYNYYNYTSDNGATWHNPSQTRFTSGISGNACDGEYMVWCSTLEGNPWNIAFQTLPNSSSRQNVSIALSTDEGATFGEAKTICPRGSAYSAAVVLPDGTLGVYYEENGVFGGYTMRFVRFSLDWASNGQYKFTEEAPFYPIKSTVISNPDEEATINVTLTDANGNTYCDVLENCALGSVKEVLAEKYPYITLGTEERLTETADGEAYDYTNSVTLPFAVSNGTTTTWNNIYFPSNTNTGHPIYLAANSASDTYVPKVTEAVAYGSSQYNTLDYADKISWAIYNVNNGFAFTFKNKFTGKYLKVENIATGNAQNVSFADEANATAFTLVPDAASYNGDFALASVTGEATGYVCSTAATYGYATNYNGNAHQGAWVKIVEAPDYATLVAQANAAIASLGDKVGQFQVAEANQALLTEAKSAMSNAGGVKLQKLNAYIALTEGATLNMPQAGGFYRISYDYGTAGVKYLQGVASSVKGVAYTADKGAESIFYYADDQLLSYTAGTYLKEVSNTRGLQGVGVAGGTVTFAQSTRDAGKYTIAVPSFLHANVSGTEYFADHCGSDGGHAAHDHAIEAVEELPVTIGTTGYSTFYTPVALEIPEGITAYYAVVNGEYIDLYEFEGTIPANQAAILKGTQGTHYFAITDDVEFTGTNNLQGTVKKIATSSVTNPYTLQSDATAEEGVVMRKSNGTNINGFKMYMSISDAEAAAFSFRFPTGTTAIESVEAESNGRVYDLFGRPVENPTKGIYVVDGNKVIY